MDLTGMFDVTQAMLFIGIMAFIVSVITEAVKKIDWWESRVPTALTVILLSLVLCPAAYAALMAWMKQPIEWYMVFASFIAAFVVALTAMDGWERVTELAGRMIPKNGKQ